MVASLCFATAATSSANVATLFWAVLFSPVWVLVVKLHGLYDHDHRRIRHSTLDELPALVSASALGTLALDGLLALTPAGALTLEHRDPRRRPRLRRQLRVARADPLLLAAPDRRRGRPRDRPSGGGRQGRAADRDPPRGAPAAGRLPAPPRRARRPQPGLPRLGTVDDIARVAQEQGVERVIVTEQDLGEAAAEALIEECKIAGLGLTFLPRHYGLLGRGSSSTASPSCRSSTSASPTRRARRSR